jgi:hypothetical protein
MEDNLETKPARRHPRFRRKKKTVTFCADHEVAHTLNALSLNALPSDVTGQLPSISQCANALLTQAIKQIGGRALWLSPKQPQPLDVELADMAGYALVSAKSLEPDAFQLDFDNIEKQFNIVVPFHAWHCLEALRRGLTILCFEGSHLRVIHGWGLVREYKI